MKVTYQTCCGVYVKPEEFTAYYVINDDVTGSIDL